MPYKVWEAPGVRHNGGFTYREHARKSLRKILPTFDFGKSSRNSNQLWHLIIDEFTPAKIAHGGGVESRIAAHDKRLDRFASRLIGHADDRAFLHARKSGEYRFTSLG